MTKYIFPDTNVFLHCKIFTEIKWKNLFDKEVNKIIIIVPDIVLDELDNLKYKEGKAGKIITKIRNLRNTEFQDKVLLKTSANPPNWNLLKPEFRERLDKNKNDHLIITEILNFSDNHQDDDIYFITGDSGPEIKAIDLGINTIFWRDIEYKDLFQIPKISKKRQSDLELTFKDNKKCIEIPTDIPQPKLIEYPQLELPNSHYLKVEDIMK